MLQTIAIHDVRPEHLDAFRAFMGKVETAVAGADGLLEIGSWHEVRTGRLVAVARWESQAAFEAAAPAIMGLSSERDPAWTGAEDELLVLAGA
ncbi:MAG: hypothetical protein AVDCRST_MAG13-3319 [uncultured Solirubrobacteraceae bacterium]|uniref:ABM domain-containing protein n=1 Tax=uncultured Solirubrobacteraceae bacterium TaxID=1162706 RepID=A0A6J4TD51_9ACTN|nr:MAG: hypothetical protein AVDCRST_MAG13-3319 [uncultured Solirubrobacteraceae bacterium]